MGKVIAVCISEKKGTQKHPVEEAEFVEDWGIKNDAHAERVFLQEFCMEEASVREWSLNRLTE